MPRKKGQIQKTQQWAIDLITNTAYGMEDGRGNEGKSKFPFHTTAVAVQERSRSEAERLGYDPDEIPGVRKVLDILKEIRDRAEPETGQDAPWSMGEEGDDKAYGVLLDMMKYCTTHTMRPPLTKRTAKWASKLRWVSEAGGSPQGEVVSMERLYLWASLYAGREKTFEKVRGTTKGMQTGVLDAHLMLPPAVRNLAIRIYAVPTDKGIDYGDTEDIEYIHSEELEEKEIMDKTKPGSLFARRLVEEMVRRDKGKE